MSSAGESIFALDSDSPNRIAFNLERVMRTKYVIDDFQQTYDNAMMAQAQHTATCNAKHHVEERVCRWPVEIHDRVGNTPIPLKQSTLARLLGVRRTTVTMVSVRLEKDGVLVCLRGSVEVLRRDDGKPSDTGEGRHGR
jgi:CRP-like cAMP-binding protein